MTTQNLDAFIKANNLTHIMGKVNIGNEYLYSYAKTKSSIILKYHSKFDNFSLQVQGYDKNIIDITVDKQTNKLFEEIISRLAKATPVEKSVSTMVDDMNLGI